MLRGLCRGHCESDCESHHKSDCESDYKRDYKRDYKSHRKSHRESCYTRLQLKHRYWRHRETCTASNTLRARIPAAVAARAHTTLREMTTGEDAYSYNEKLHFIS